VAALIPKAEVEGEMGDSHMGLQARMMSQALRKLTGKVSKAKVTVIFINQIREKIGVMFGSNETTTGGRALKFFSSMRIDIRKTGTIKEGEVPVANNVKVKIVKNKLSPPFKDAELQINFAGGFDVEAGILKIASLPDINIVQKSGSWYNYGAVRLGLGEAKASEFLRGNPDIVADITAAVKAKVAPMVVEDTTPEAELVEGEIPNDGPLPVNMPLPVNTTTMSQKPQV
jgi:recombination protein RecA